jgi:hypothetical protein
VAVFPLSALVSGSEIRVVFDRTARGFSGLSMCRECTVPVNLNRLGWRQFRFRRPVRFTSHRNAYRGTSASTWLSLSAFCVRTVSDAP